MADYDGDIKLSVGLDPADVKKIANQLKSELEKSLNVSVGKNTVADLTKVETILQDIGRDSYLLTSIMGKLAKKVEIVFSEMTGIGGVRVPTEEYKKLSEELDKLIKQKNDLQGIKDLGAGSMHAMQKEIADINGEIAATQDKMRKLEEEGKAFTIGSDAAIYDKFINQLNELCAQMKMVADAFSNIAKNANQATNQVQANTGAAEQANVSNRVGEAEKKANDEAKKHGEQSAKKFDKLKSAAAGVAQAVGKVVSTLGKLSVKGVQKLVTGFKKVASLVANITKKVGSLAKKMLHLGDGVRSQQFSWDKIIKKVFAYGIGISSLVAAFNRLRGYAKSALQSMAKQFDEVDVKVSGIVNSFNQFKNSIGTIVEPLLNLFAPAIERIIQGMTAMSNKIANFVAVFTGQEYIYKATKSNKKYSDSLKDTAKAAKEANEKLGEYDNLLVIQQQTQSSASDSDSSAEPAFEKVAVSPSGFATSLKDAITGGDWASIGKDLATKLNNAIAGINANGIAKSLAEKINNATSLIANFLTTFSFTGLGEKLGGALSTFLTTLDFGNIATSIGASIKGKFDFITSFLSSIEWEEITTNVINGFKRVNWVQVAQSIIKALKTAFSSAIKVVNTIAKEIDGKQVGEDVGNIFNDIVTSISELIEELDWQGVAEDIGGFLSGALGTIDWGELFRTAASLVIHLADALTTIISEIDWEDLGHSIYEGFTSINWGELCDSIFKAVGAAIGGLGMLLGTFIMDGIADLFTYFEQSIEDSGGDIVLGILNGIINGLVGIGTWLYDHLFKPIWEGICEVFGIHSPSKETEKLGGFVVDGFLAAFDGLKKAICSIFNAALNVIRIPINMIIGFVNTMIGAVESGINFIIRALNKLHWKAPDWLGGWSFGFNFSELSFWKIPEIPEAHFGEGSDTSVPKLAQGAVIPPNREFLAVLGDQRVGTNIEAPLDTIVAAFNTALNSRTDTRQAAPIVLQLNGRTVAQAVWDEEEKRYRQTGSYRPNFA